MREVKLLQSIRHDNVICLLDVFHVRRRLYLVFEYIEGTVLQARYRRIRPVAQFKQKLLLLHSMFSHSCLLLYGGIKENFDIR